jgi:hypothetical protein
MAGKLTAAQRRVLNAYADGQVMSAAYAAKRLNIPWPASGNFGKTVRKLMLMGLLSFNSLTAAYQITPAGRTALEDKP